MRYLLPYIQKDLRKKMVFISGPRQVGKTTLAKDLLLAKSGRYFNWDDEDQKIDLMKRRWLPEEKLLIFDEIHKFSRWRNWLKGTYDTQQEAHQFCVTGSARLDVYRRGGDSLVGRYHHWRLHPFSLFEHPDGFSSSEVFERLMTVGGFPEPFTGNDIQEAKRWRRERKHLVLREDLRDLEKVTDVSNIEILVELLRERVGGQIVVSNLAKDLHVSPNAVKYWITILEKLYFTFAVRPYSKKLSRAVQKAPKIYFYDNADVIDEEGGRFENLVATHLLKLIHFYEDSTGDSYELRYLRDKEKREIDFVVLKNQRILWLIEAKVGERNISSSLKYYKNKLMPHRAIQLISGGGPGYAQDGIEVMSAQKFFFGWDLNNNL